MLIYSRMKSVGVQKQGEHRRVVGGVLEDELYAMECEIAVAWPDLIIESVQTRMKRFTTKRCLLAQTHFEKLEGRKLGLNLDFFLKKELSPDSCRHMSSLLGDCCRTLARAEFTRDFLSALADDPGLDKKLFVDAFVNKYPELDQYLRLY